MLASTAKTRTARLSWQVGKSLVMPGKALLLSQSLPCPFPAAQASLALPPRERITVGALALAYANLRQPYTSRRRIGVGAQADSASARCARR